MKTTLTSEITIDPAAWKRVRKLATLHHRPLPEVIGDLLDQASAELASEAPKKGEYEAPPLTRLWVRKHPDSLAERD